MLDVKLSARCAKTACAIIILMFSSSSYPHEIRGASEPAHAWSDDVWTWVTILLAGGLYWNGYQRLRSKSRLTLHRQSLSFAAGWIAVALALLSPLDSLGGVSFSAHMVQHEVLMLIAAPLLVASQPLAIMMWGMPSTGRRLVALLIKAFALDNVYRAVSAPVAAWLLHALALWSWHAPLLFQAALRSEAVHAAQHLSFLLSALLFWTVLLPARATRVALHVGLLYLLTTAMHNALLGALLALSDTLWYPHYASTGPWGWTALEDQQLGGLIMWVPAGAVYLCVGLALCARGLVPASRTPVRGLSSDDSSPHGQQS